MQMLIARRILIAAASLCAVAARLPAGSGVLNPDGTADLTMNFRFPVTVEFLASMEVELTGASEILWDATEGQVRLGTITFTCTLQNEDAADIWVFGSDGRAGSSSRCGGGSMGRPGDHVTMFVTSRLRSDVIAHELGHLIFGLKDEYGEQRRFGECWGIGPCIDGADITEQNHCLMQQAAPAGSVATELCTPTRHDILRGDGLTCEEQAVPHGCDERCEGFNHTTDRYESSSMTINCDPDGCWNRMVINFPFLTAPADLPEADAPDGFVAPTFVDACDAASDTIILALDASGSMNESVDPEGGEICANGVDDDDDGETDEVGCKESRLSFLKSAARLFLQKLRPSNVRVGVISFDCTPALEAAIQDLDVSFDAIEDATQGLAAGGGTAIGRALASTPLLFSAETDAVHPSIFLITDGFNTCGEDPASVVPDLNAEGIRVYTLGAGEAADSEVVTQISADTGGATLASSDLRSFPSLAAQILAQKRGDGLVLPGLPFLLDADSGVVETSARGVRTSKAWLENNTDQPKPAPINNVFEILVEEGSQSLSLALSGSLNNMAGFGVEVALKGPTGANPGAFDSETPSPFLRVVRDPFFLLLDLRNPNPGLWTANVRIRNGADDLQIGSVTASVDNPRTRLFASLDKYVVDDGDDSVLLNVLPTYHTSLHNVDEIVASVIAPDGSLRKVVLTEDADLAEGYSGRMSDFTLEGRYEVRVRLRTGQGDFNHPGEPIFAKDGPENTVKVPLLERSVTLHFFLQRGSGKKACKNGNTADCDGDGVEGESERNDTDGDGLPDNCDPDADGDEIPDGQEWKGQPTDLDRDGKPDHLDPDADGDGLHDSVDPEVSLKETIPRVKLDDVVLDAPCGPIQRLHVRYTSTDAIVGARLGLNWDPSLIEVVAIELGPDVAAKAVGEFKAQIGTDGLRAGEAFASLDVKPLVPAGRDLRLFAVQVRAARSSQPKLLGKICTANNVGGAANDTVLIVDRKGVKTTLPLADACGAAETVADRTPPVFENLLDLVIPCAPVAGARVDFDVKASDHCGSVKVSTEPRSGTVFADGTTNTIFCVAEDESGNVAFGTFDVFVGDIIPPQFRRPSIPVVDATGPAGAVVEYKVEVTDNCRLASVACTPPSGAVFPIGTTTVHCVARDAAGNEAEMDFDVTVRADTSSVFLRGDCDGNGRVGGNVNDAVVILLYNFQGGREPPCLAACDANGDGQVIGQVTDGVYLLAFSFLGGAPPPPPFPRCGPGTSEKDRNLGCRRISETCR